MLIFIYLLQHSFDFLKRIIDKTAMNGLLYAINEQEFIDKEHSELYTILYDNIKKKFINKEYLQLAELYSEENTYKIIKEKHLNHPELSLIGMLVCDDQEYHEKYFLATMESNKNLNLENKFHKNLVDTIKRELIDHDIKKFIRNELLDESFHKNAQNYLDFTCVLEPILSKFDDYKDKNIELIFAILHFDCFLNEVKDPSNNEFYIKLLEEKSYFFSFL